MELRLTLLSFVTLLFLLISCQLLKSAGEDLQSNHVFLDNFFFVTSIKIITTL